MSEMFIEWSTTLKDFNLPLWEQLPDMDLYKDQVVTLVQRYIGNLYTFDDKLITPSIINNYVKWKVIPRPNKKKQYNRTHLIYLITISILKQVFTIEDIKKGIEYELKRDGEEAAYNNFVRFFKESLEKVVLNINNENKFYEISEKEIPVRLACDALAYKLVVQRYISFSRKNGGL